VTNFVALYRGDNIIEARLIAATCDPAIVATMARMMLQTPPDATDEVFASLEQGKRRALRLVRHEVQDVAQD
jgi:hypothetical protein